MTLHTDKSSIIPTNPAFLWGEGSGHCESISVTVSPRSWFVVYKLHPNVLADRDLAVQCFAFLTRLLRKEGASFTGDGLSPLLCGKSIICHPVSREHAVELHTSLSRIPGILACAFSAHACKKKPKKVKR